MKLQALAVIAMSLGVALSAHSSNIELNTESYVEACTDVLYQTDPMINLAVAMGKKIGPGVRNDVADMCVCFANEQEARLQRNGLTVEGFDFLIDQQFIYFQQKQLKWLHPSVRPDIAADVQKCAPHFIMLER